MVLYSYFLMDMMETDLSIHQLVLSASFSYQMLLMNHQQKE